MYFTRFKTIEMILGTLQVLVPVGCMHKPVMPMQVNTPELVKTQNFKILVDGIGVKAKIRKSPKRKFQGKINNVRHIKMTASEHCIVMIAVIIIL